VFSPVFQGIGATAFWVIKPNRQLFGRALSLPFAGNFASTAGIDGLKRQRSEALLKR
jgi:hypothetical protein